VSEAETHPYERIDCAGALWLIRGAARVWGVDGFVTHAADEIVAIDGASLTIRCGENPLTLRRRQPRGGEFVCLAWELGS
jgi:hypothetical protein